MDLNTLRTVLLVACFAVFMAISLWALGKGRRARFEEAAWLPFADEAEDARAEGSRR